MILRQQQNSKSLLWVLWLALALTVMPKICFASSQPLVQELTWYEFDYPIEESDLYINRGLETRKPVLIAQPKLTGGHYLSMVQFTVPALDWYVIDFSGSTLIGQFRHHIIDADGNDVAIFSGGLLDDTPNPVMLRHGRKLILQPGEYQLFTQQQSQFNIATPTPFIMLEKDYLAEIKPGNAIALIGLGVFAGLGILYLTLGANRFRTTDLAYSAFIFGNFLFNATTLLVFSDLFGVQWYRGASLPICFSNIAYIVFVTRLLGIQSHNTPILYRLGQIIIGVYVVVLFAGFIFPHWQMEMNRYGVGLFLAFGLLCGLNQMRSGVAIAKYYLLANLGFVFLGSIAISQNGLEDRPTIYMSHIGLLGVAIEVVLLSFVLAYQMHIAGREKASALKAAKNSLVLAQTDDLTQIENRRAMDTALCEASPTAAFAYLDLDGLKQCNDLKGHRFGDELLVRFASRLTQDLAGAGRLFRIGGDEFGVLFDAQLRSRVETAIRQTELDIQSDYYAPFGISFGVALREECSSIYRMVEEADQSMYKHKTSRRAKRIQRPSTEETITPYTGTDSAV
jgi:diguanylate cyclase (GGDEF)-like protein